jgi:HK97 family phage portal protein
MIDKTLTVDQRAKIKQNFADLAEGNEDRLFVLEADMKYEQVSLSPQDIELLQSRKFQIEDICRFFGVPSILVNDNQQTTAWGTGISQIIQGFYKFGLRPYASRYAASMKANLLTPAERDTIDISFDFDDLLQADYADRVKSGKDGITGGLITPNEWRAGEGLSPVPGGDKLFLQQQMTPIDQLETIDRNKGQGASSVKGTE